MSVELSGDHRALLESRITFAMSVQVYGCNHIAIEVDDVKAAVRFGESDAGCGIRDT